MNWELIEVPTTEWMQDTSGLFSYISYCPDDTVRLDIMADTGLTPVISFQGKAEDVRKTAVRYLAEEYKPVYVDDNLVYGRFSYEHASYIGSELAKAELLKDRYIQD